MVGVSPRPGVIDQTSRLLLKENKETRKAFASRRRL